MDTKYELIRSHWRTRRVIIEFTLHYKAIPISLHRNPEPVMLLFVPATIARYCTLEALGRTRRL